MLTEFFESWIFANAERSESNILLTSTEKDRTPSSAHDVYFTLDNNVFSRSCRYPHHTCWSATCILSLDNKHHLCHCGFFCAFILSCTSSVSHLEEVVNKNGSCRFNILWALEWNTSESCLIVSQKRRYKKKKSAADQKLVSRDHDVWDAFGLWSGISCCGSVV